MEPQQDLICQSCAMPLKKDEDFGTNEDGSRCEEYCFHCFKDGRFLDEGITLEDKIEKNIKFAMQMGIPEDVAKQMCEDILPRLKRWRED